MVVRFHLHHREGTVAVLEKLVQTVSDPSHPSFLLYPDRKAIHELLSPPDAVIGSVDAYLSRLKREAAHRWTHRFLPARDTVEVETTRAGFERAFGVPLNPLSTAAPKPNGSQRQPRARPLGKTTWQLMQQEHPLLRQHVAFITITDHGTRDGRVVSPRHANPGRGRRTVGGCSRSTPSRYAHPYRGASWP